MAAHKAALAVGVVACQSVRGNDTVDQIGLDCGPWPALEPDRHRGRPAGAAAQRSIDARQPGRGTNPGTSNPRDRATRPSLRTVCANSRVSDNVIQEHQSRRV